MWILLKTAKTTSQSLLTPFSAGVSAAVLLEAMTLMRGVDVALGQASFWHIRAIVVEGLVPSRQPRWAFCDCQAC